MLRNSRELLLKDLTRTAGGRPGTSRQVSGLGRARFWNGLLRPTGLEVSKGGLLIEVIAALLASV